MKIVLSRFDLHSNNAPARDALDIDRSATDAQLRKWFRALLDYHDDMQAVDRTVMIYDYEGGIALASVPSVIEFKVDVPLAEAPDDT